MTSTKCVECGGELIEHEGGEKCPLCDDITIYTVDEDDNDS